MYNVYNILFNYITKLNFNHVVIKIRLYYSLYNLKLSEREIQINQKPGSDTEPGFFYKYML